MKADIEWSDRPEPGVKRKIRVTFTGSTGIKWQFKRSDEELWDYDTPPTADDWDALEDKVNGLYNRRRIPYKRVELVQRLKQTAGQEQ